MTLSKNKVTLPSFFDVFEVKYFFENRIRVRVEKLKKNPELFNSVNENLVKIKGIEKVKYNSYFGDITVIFDESKIDVALVVGVLLKLLELEEEVFKPKKSSLRTEIKEYVNSLDMLIYNKTRGNLDLNMTVGGLFVLYGIKRINNMSLPNGGSLLWWGYNLIVRSRD